MIKKEYMKPALTMVTLLHTQVLCVSEVSTTGLGSDNLNYNKGTGDMSGAMVKGNNYNVWDDNWSE